MTGTAVATLTDKQKKFLLALQSEELVSIPKKERMRWCARFAGYEDTTTIADITRPIQEQIKETVERRLNKLTLDAAIALEEALDEDNIHPIKTRIKVDVAKDILDRVIPKKEPKSDRQAPLVVIQLPAKNTTIIDG